MEIMRARHSVRQYTGQPIEEEKRQALLALVRVCNRESGLNIQLLFDEPKCFGGLRAKYGSFKGVRDYISLVGPKGEDLDELAGYYGERLVLKAQELGLNTCWVALTHGKSAAAVGPGEKEACIISLGYGENQGKPHKNRPMEQVMRCAGPAPEWFLRGMEAVMLAPTAINQQKFLFTLSGDTVTAEPLSDGPCVNMDLGIVKYHFERATGIKVK